MMGRVGGGAGEGSDVLLVRAVVIGGVGGGASEGSVV